MRRKLRWPTNANLRRKTWHTTPTSHCLSRGVAAHYVLKRGRGVGAGVVCLVFGLDERWHLWATAENALFTDTTCGYCQCL